MNAVEFILPRERTTVTAHDKKYVVSDVSAHPPKASKQAYKTSLKKLEEILAPHISARLEQRLTTQEATSSKIPVLRLLGLGATYNNLPPQTREMHSSPKGALDALSSVYSLPLKIHPSSKVWVREINGGYVVDLKVRLVEESSNKKFHEYSARLRTP